MHCSTCGAPVQPGAYKCDYCGEAIRLAPPPSAPAGASGVAPGGGVPADTALRVRALAADGCWYCCAITGRTDRGLKVRWDDGREAELPPEMVREPALPMKLQVGTRVLGEYQGRYFPGTIRQVGDRQWNVLFDDGETAMVPADRLAVWEAVLPPVPPGQQVLAQEGDGCWYPGRVLSGPDGQGRQRVRFDAGGEALVSRLQLNGPSGPELLQVGRRVLGIGEDGCWYPGTVVQATQGQAYVRYEDGDEAWMFAHQVRFIC